MPDMDSQIQISYEMTPISAIQYILMFDLQLTSNFDLQITVTTSSNILAFF